VRTCFEVLTHPKLNHQVDITSESGAGVCNALQRFFHRAPLSFALSRVCLRTNTARRGCASPISLLIYFH